MGERLHAIWTLITAPFPLFLICLMFGACFVAFLWEVKHAPLYDENERPVDGR